MKKRILIMDDDQERIDAFNCMFVGNRIDACMHADECIRLLQRHVYDLIFLDHDLNGTQYDYDEDDCGTVVAEWINKNPIRGQVIIHSYNSNRAAVMKSMIPGAEYVPGAWLIDVGNFKFMEENIQ